MEDALPVDQVVLVIQRHGADAELADDGTLIVRPGNGHGPEAFHLKDGHVKRRLVSRIASIVGAPVHHFWNPGQQMPRA